MIKKHSNLAAYLLTSLCLSMSACSPTFEEDLSALCTMAQAPGPKAEGAKMSRIAQVFTEFHPEAKRGGQLKVHVLAQPPGIMYTRALEHIEVLKESPSTWTCPALQELQEEAAAEERESARAELCQAMEPALDEIAYVLVPLFRSEITGVIQDTLPEATQQEAQRLFEQEYAVKLKMAESQPDAGLEATTQRIRELAGCTPAAPPEDACAQIEMLIPRLPSNRRVVLIGEAYGEALMQLGLDPSKFSKPLQDRLIELARTQLVKRLEPGVARLSDLTQCTFK